MLPMAAVGWSAEVPASTKKTAITPAPGARTPPPRSGARGPLPDPVLLDGSTHKPEKKSEYGMIGDFELPGDENAKNNNRVGGTQNPGQPGSAGQPNALPQGGAAGAQGQPQAGAAKSGAPPAGAAGQQNSAGSDKQIAGGGDPNAKPEGVQVAELGGDTSGQSPAGSGERPQPVAIGDSGMKIQTIPAAAGVVGSQQQIVGNTQHHEKGTGSGGKGPTGVQGGNRVEKGRTIPAGL